MVLPPSFPGSRGVYAPGPGAAATPSTSPLRGDFPILPLTPDPPLVGFAGGEYSAGPGTPPPGALKRSAVPKLYCAQERFRISLLIEICGKYVDGPGPTNLSFSVWRTRIVYALPFPR